MKTVLFAWELGSGAGHVMNIRRLARRLRQSHNVRIVAAISRLDSIAWLDEISEIHRMPNWRSASDYARNGETTSSATLNDMLVAAGFANPEMAQRNLDAWMRLFRAVKPDLVIADYAPAAALAARHRIPLLMVGNGFTLPPDDMDAFPLLHQMSPPLHRDEDTLAAVNAVARAVGLQTLDRLPQLFAGDARLVNTLPLLDPYAHLRRIPADGPLIEYVPRARQADARQVLVYISPGVEVRDDVVAALRPIVPFVRILAPMLSESGRVELASGGARIEQQPIDLSSALRECRLLVHLGGTGMAAEAVLAGVPQLCHVTHIDQYLNAVALERAGIGRHFAANDRARRLSTQAIEEMIQDEALASYASEFGSRQRQLLGTETAFDVFDRACKRLLP